MSAKPQTGDMYTCQKCSAQIQITRACECDSPCADFRCCGDTMKNITEPTVRNASDTEVMDGYENNSSHVSSPTPKDSIAEQTENAKRN